MSTDIEIFENKEFGQVRTLNIDGEPWFVGKDVAEAIGYSNTRDALQNHVESIDKGVSQIATTSGTQNMTIVNESGLYSLIFGGKLESAKRFKHWVTSEVLPAIRKTGMYNAPDKRESIISARELAAMLKRKQCKVCYRIDGLLERHPEYAAEFVSGTFRNAQGRVFRTYELTEKGLELFVNLLEKDGDRNSYNTVKGIQRIKDLHPGIQTKGLPSGAETEVLSCPRTALKELQKAEAVLEMFERCYLGMDFAEFDAEDRERFDSALCLLHDQVRQAVDEAKGA